MSEYTLIKERKMVKFRTVDGSKMAVTEYEMPSGFTNKRIGECAWQAIDASYKNMEYSRKQYKQLLDNGYEKI
jgi:hypothetical protein